jgi:hypothetical protein
VRRRRGCGVWRGGEGGGSAGSRMGLLPVRRQRRYGARGDVDSGGGVPRRCGRRRREGGVPFGGEQALDLAPQLCGLKLP